MHQDTREGQWKELKRKLRIRWGRLSDEDLAGIEGHADVLVGVLQHRYGLAAERARSDSEAFFDTCDQKTHDRR